MSVSTTYRVVGMTCGHCVRDAVAAGGPEADVKVAEARRAIERLVRS